MKLVSTARKWTATAIACLTACWCTAVALGAPPSKAEPLAPQAVEFFEKRVRPVLIDNCHECHGAKKQKGGLRLDSRTALLRGGDGGPVVRPGNPDKSPLIQAIRHQGELKMPPKKKLTDEAVEALTAWVRLGIPWPESANSSADADAWKKHWAFQPIRKPAVPAVKQGDSASTPLDRFVLAKLESKGWTAAKSADRRTLVRRASFDLIGLPPQPEEVEAALSDKSPEWFDKVVDRLLASPHFGERWGRYWLDVARYADERGYVGVRVDRVYPFAHTYRDWVIRAFNEDLPYDRFLQEQLAADQLVTGDDRRALAAMGFLTVGRRFLNNAHDIIDDRIDVVARGTLGLTVTCARCHDHKYDPIPAKDYYSLHGVFASSQEPEELPVLDPHAQSPALDAFQKELQQLEEKKARFVRDNEAMRKEKPSKYREDLKPFDNNIRQLHANHPGAPPRGMVLVDKPEPVKPHVFLRGNPNNLGEEVPRQFLLVVAGDKRTPFQKGSGRLELAQAITSRDNPLTARVMVNRIWLHLFGAGLVRTPSDFGLRSEPPSHPELLDYLAARFMDDGWSIKKTIRLIMLSRVYQQSSDGNPDYQRTDPDNLLLWDMNRRRLDFEAMRDSFLAVAGRLDGSVGGRPVALATVPFSRRRTIYGFIDRQNLPGMFRSFDFASPDTHSPQRFTTTVPQQALFLMNSPFVVEQARHLAGRADIVSTGPPEQRIRRIHRILYGRDPTDEEKTLGLRFLETAGAESKGSLTAWEKYVQVLLLSNEFAFVD